MISSAATIGIVGAIIILGVILTILSKRTKSPLIILLLILGIILGPLTKVFTPAEFEPIIHAVVTFALVVILFDVGYGIKLHGLEKKLETAAGLAVVGVLITIGLVMLAARFLLGFDWLLSALLGALVASTDLTILAPALENLKISKFIKDSLDLEATMNSIPAVIIAIVVVNVMEIGKGSVAFAARTFFYNIFVGIGMGAVCGYVIFKIIQKLSPDQKPHILSLGAVFLIYAITELIGASGIAAALIVGIIFGNAKPQLPKIIHSFGGEMELLLVTFVYVILGAILRFDVFLSYGLWTFGIIAVFVASILLARFLAIRITSSKLDPAVRKLQLIGGPRGIVCAVLALSYSSQFPNPELIIAIVFSIILVTSFSVFMLPSIANKLPRKLRK